MKSFCRSSTPESEFDKLLPSQTSKVRISRLSYESFAEAIGLSEGWPKETPDVADPSTLGLLTWAKGYLWAAERLHFALEGERHLPVYAGPVVQNTGLATELTLKALLRGSGMGKSAVRKFGHNTYKAYCAAKEHFDEVKFINLHFSNTSHLTVPDEVRERYEGSKEDPELGWRVYFDQLRVLDTMYDRPFKGRYITPGSIVLPETELVLVGTKILLSAMEERVSV